MSDTNKPEATDPESPELSDTGGVEDVKPESGPTTSNPSDNNAPVTKEEVEALTLNELNKLAGREGDNAFKSKDDFTKHYDNLKSFVGKPKEEPASSDKKEEDMSASELKKLNEQLEEERFLRRNPDIKEDSTDYELLKKFANAEGKSLQEAYKEESFQNLISDIRAGRESKSTETAVESNQRVGTGADVSDELKGQAAAGDPNAQSELMEKMGLLGNQE